MIKEQLYIVKSKISVQDKIDAAKILGCHVVTIERYLRGHIGREVFALQILKVLKRMINEREAEVLNM